MGIAFRENKNTANVQIVFKNPLTILK